MVLNKKKERGMKVQRTDVDTREYRQGDSGARRCREREDTGWDGTGGKEDIVAESERGRASEGG
jgi:hypothetical protein